MAWVITPPTHTTTPAPGWVTDAAHRAPPIPPQGWLGSGGQTVIANPTGTGTLTAAVRKIAWRDMAVGGGGQLTAAVIKVEQRAAASGGDGALSIAYAQIHPAAPLFGSEGTLFADVVNVTIYPAFSGGGALSPYQDGLTASMAIGAAFAVGTGADGTLSVSVFAIEGVEAAFSGEGNVYPAGPPSYAAAAFGGSGALAGNIDGLTATVTVVIDGLTADVRIAP